MRGPPPPGAPGTGREHEAGGLSQAPPPGPLRQQASELAETSVGGAAELGLDALARLPPADDRRRELLAFVVPVLGALARVSDIEALAGPALSEGLDPATEAAVRFGIATGFVRAGRSVSALHHIRLGLERSGVSAKVHSGLLNTQAAIVAPTDPARAAALASTAMREARAARSVGATVGGRIVQTTVALHRGRLRHALSLASRAVVQADGGRMLARLPHPRRVQVMALIGLGRFDDALATADDGRQEAEVVGSPWFLAVCEILSGLAHLGAGRLEQAAEHTQAALAGAAEHGFGGLESQACAILAEVAVRQGDLARARECVDRSLPLADAAWELIADPRWPLAGLAVAEERPAAAARALGDTLAQLRRRRFAAVALDASRLPLIVRLTLQAGDRSAAEAAAAAAGQLAERNRGVPWLAGCAAHAEGLLAADPRRLEDAVATLGAGPRPLAHAEALEDLGRTLAERTGGRRRALGALEAAQAVFAAAGAARDAARTRGLLRSLGARHRYAATRSRPLFGWGSLTESERATALLVAEGLTNRAIASRLFVSPNTVGTHLRHVFAKLRVRTRVELAGIAAQQVGDPLPGSAASPPAESAPPVAATRSAARVEDPSGEDVASVDGLCARAQIALRRGRLGLALESAAEAVRRADVGGAEARRRHPRLLLALTALANDRLDDAENALVMARQEAQEYGSVWTLPHASALEISLLMARGDPRVAGIEAEPFALLLGWGLAPTASTGDEGPLPATLLAVHPPAAPRAVRVALRAEETELAVAAARQIAEVGRRNRGVPSLVGCGLHALGLVEKNVERLHTATTVLRTGPRPLALASALEDLAVALERTGDRGAAIDAYREALELFATAAATSDAARIRGELRALGAHGRYRVPTGAGSRGWDSLTRTERAVASLIAQGLSNRRVAERLFVAGSTIDTHVRHIYGKLGLNSRVELARMVAALTAR